MLENDLRLMAVVKRWGIVPTVKDQNNAEHSYFVTMYTNDICFLLQLTDDLTLAALQKALWHDVDEIFIGDFPGPHKRMFIDRDRFNNASEKMMDEVFDNRPVRNGSYRLKSGSIEKVLVEHVVKTADLLEGAVFMSEENRVFGNREAADHAEKLFSNVRREIKDIEALGYNTMQLNRAIEILNRGLKYRNSRMTY